MFSAVLSLPRSPHEAKAVADALDALVRALREWPAAAWKQVRATAPNTLGAIEPGTGLSERLIPLAAPLALDARRREEAIRSAESVAAVLRVLWPQVGAARSVWSGEPRQASRREAETLALT